uniref:Peptidoglycan recognition protein n=1 Tax=Pectinophora gossypiella TaxID=13191 RepID=A0A1E1W7N6_PECGO
MWPDGEGPSHNGHGRASSGSEVVVIGDQVTSTAALQPTISNIHNSTKCHIGPKFVSISQTVHSNEVVKDLSCPRYLWDLVKNSTRAERVLCSIASLLVILCIFLIVYFTVIAKPNEEEPDTAPWNISREMWLAEPYSYTNEIDSVFEPLRLVIIQHSAGSECHRFASCASVLRNIQGYYIKVKHRDIPYNFQIGNDGRVYEGRGWRKEGAHTQFYNRCSVGIGFLGDYREELIGHSSVTALQQTRAHMLLNAGVQMGFLHPDYYVVGASDIQRDGTESPGSNLYRAIQQWAHFDHENRFRNKSCDEINAMFKRN